jgi:hypothetical protein
MAQAPYGDNPLSLTVEEWKARGSDRHSIIANPMFKNLETRDFTLGKDSPAWELGVEPIDMSTVGPRPPDKR